METIIGDSNIPIIVRPLNEEVDVSPNENCLKIHPDSGMLREDELIKTEEEKKSVVLKSTI
ncbi:hypothetical protein O9G_004958 [Rozella allomycis CSF55]|uniref:Uncharacterized protein n=1 Tax=Rozella allomycis (strain CSF55) TaxID=988480 RepID=A0A075APR2_ROZAC|nr:hypothetical protein O9G_004958 [Rozella allomycis CSF55]|eukprot:EPZ32184.1 hypothetical protein O9G_004958 [Rozella allomycis CSF55]